MRVPDPSSGNRSSKEPRNSQEVAAARVAERVEDTDVSGPAVAGGEADGAKRRGLKRRVIAAAEAAEPQRVSRRTRRDGASTAKDRISKIPPCAVGKRSSIYRGVTRHRWTGRFEAHLWDKSTWNQSQNKKGKQVYLGAYDEEEAAARAYDLAALKYWGPGTILNFPVTQYTGDIEEMQNVSREEYLASLRRKSSGFSRGVSKYRGVARHHHNGRWEARIGRVFGNKYLYLGTYSTQEEAAAAYDMAAIEYRGLNAVTNFDLSRYITWLRPGQANLASIEEEDQKPGEQQQQQQLEAEAKVEHVSQAELEELQVEMWPGQESELDQFPLPGSTKRSQAETPVATAPTALGLLWQSNMFKQMLEKASAQSTSDSQQEGDVFGMPILAGMGEDSTLTYEQAQSDGVFQDVPLPSCFPDSQELDSGAPFWTSLGASVVPLRSRITV